VESFDRLYVPRKDPRWLRRNAAVALGNTGGPEDVPALARAAEGDDELVAEHARWALERITDRE
jgi:epoxyqueuosine reductase